MSKIYTNVFSTSLKDNKQIHLSISDEVEVLIFQSYFKKVAPILGMLFLLLMASSNTVLGQVNYVSNLDVAGASPGEEDWDDSEFNGDADGACGGSGLSMKDNCFGTGTSQVVEMWSSVSLGTAVGGDLAISFDYAVFDWNTTTAAAAADFEEINVYIKSSTPTTANLGTLIYTVSSHAASATCAPVAFTHSGHTGATYIAITFEHSDVGSPDLDVIFDNISVVESTCTTPTAAYTVVPDCGNGQFTIDVNVTALGDASDVDISNNAGVAASMNAGAGVTNIGPFSAGTDVIVTVDGTNYGGCAATPSATQTEACDCAINPTATVASANLNCTTATYDIQVTVTNDGSGDANMTDILIDGVVQQADATTNQLYTFSVATGSHAVEIQAEGAGFITCNNTYSTDETCNGGDACADAVDILGTSAACDLTVATNESITDLTPCFESMGNGNTMGKGTCGGESCFENSSYWYTRYEDIWYVIDLPDGVDEFSVQFTGLSCAVAVFPYTGSCGSLSLMDITGGVGTGLADSDNNGVVETEANDNPIINTDGFIHFKGDDVATASTAPIYLRVFAQDDRAAGTACSDADIINCAFTISVSSPQPNDVCGDGLPIVDGTTFLPTTQGGNISVANADADTHDEVNGETCNGITFATGEEDLWYSLSTPSNGNYFLDLDIDYTGVAGEMYVLLHTFCSGGDTDPIGCATISVDGMINFNGSNITNFDNALTANNDYNIRIVKPIGSAATSFTISGQLVAENNTCEVMQNTFPGFDVENMNQDLNFNFATDSGVFPVTAGNDLWYQFDPVQSSDPVTGLNTASTTAEIVIGGLAAGQELTLLLYKGNTVSANNCTDLEADYLEALVVTGNGIEELACLDELHLSTSGGYLIRVVQTAGTTIDNGLINVQPQPAGPYNNDCENIWNSGPTNLGWTDPTPGPSDGINDGGAAVNFNPFVIEEGFSNYVSGDFENSTDCNPNTNSALCNGVDQQAILSNEDRDMWYIITLPDDTCPSTGITAPGVINSVTFLYNAGSSSEDGILYLYSDCGDANLIDCSGVLDGAPSGAGDDQFNDPQSTWTVSGLTQGQSYLLRVKPHDISSNGVNNEFDFDISWKAAAPAPCNDNVTDPFVLGPYIPGSDYSAGCTTGNAEGATGNDGTNSPGANTNNVWFEFTAEGNADEEGYVNIYLESLDGHAMTINVYQEVGGTGGLIPVGASTATVNTTDSNDKAWLELGHLIVGEDYFIELTHSQAADVPVNYNLCLYDIPTNRIACTSDGASISPAGGGQCGNFARDCGLYYRVEVPPGTPSGWYTFEVRGDATDLDIQLFGQGSDSPSDDGNPSDYDQPCNPTHALNSMSGAQVTLPADGTCNGGSGESAVYNLIGTSSTESNYYYLEVRDAVALSGCSMSPDDVCSIVVSGPFSTQVLAEANSTVPDGDCPTLVGFTTATSSLAENGGTVQVCVDITGSTNMPTTVDINFPTSAGSATLTDDYTIDQTLPYQITFPANSADGTTMCINFTGVDDALTEGNENINLTLENPTNGTVDPTADAHVVTINDDDATGSILQFTETTSSVGENGGTTQICVEISNVDGTAVSADVIFDGTDAGTATLTTDYTLDQTLPYTVSFPAAAVNGDQMCFTVTGVDDADNEGGETINFDLTNPTGTAVLGTNQDHTTTINDDDAAACLADNGTFDATGFTNTACDASGTFDVSGLWTGANTTGHTQQYILVGSDNIIDEVNSTGSFTISVTDNYTIYAINTEDGNEPTNLSAGNMISDISGGCFDLDNGAESVTIMVFAPVTVTPTASSESCSADDQTYSYDFTITGGSGSIMLSNILSSQAGTTVSDLGSGTYRVSGIPSNGSATISVTDDSGCATASAVQVPTAPVNCCGAMIGNFPGN